MGMIWCKLKKKGKRLLVAVVVLIVFFVTLMIVIETHSKENKVDIITKSTLEKIINVSDLSTFQAVYNGIVKVMNDYKPDQIDYYVSYEAKVKAGFDFSLVEIELNEENKVITVILPEIKITEVDVDIASLDYIFENNKANTSTVSEQAYKKCIEDVKYESSTEEDIIKIAKQNANNMMKALVTPFIHQLDSEYKLVVEYGGLV